MFRISASRNIVVLLGLSSLTLADISKLALLLINTLEDKLLAKSTTLSSYNTPLAIRYSLLS